MNDTEEYRHPDKRVLKVWRFKYIIGICFWTLVLIILLLFISDYKKATYISISIYAVILISKILSYIFIPAFKYKRRKYLITPDRIEIIKGIIFQSQELIPISRIQHITVSEGPLLRRYGLATLEVNTAGSEFDIEGLSKQDASLISIYFKDRINKKVKEGENQDAKA